MGGVALRRDGGPTPGRLVHAAGICGLVAAAWFAWGIEDSSGVVDSGSPPTRPRVREGTELVDVPGRFRLTGDRVTFATEADRRQFVVLENLNLERIVATLAETPQPLLWNVTATATEYRGANFLFVRHASLGERADQPQSFPNRVSGSAGPDDDPLPAAGSLQTP